MQTKLHTPKKRKAKSTPAQLLSFSVTISTMPDRKPANKTARRMVLYSLQPFIMTPTIMDPTIPVTTSRAPNVPASAFLYSSHDILLILSIYRQASVLLSIYRQALVLLSIYYYQYQILSTSTLNIMRLKKRENLRIIEWFDQLKDHRLARDQAPAVEGEDEEKMQIAAIGEQLSHLTLRGTWKVVITYVQV